MHANSVPDLQVREWFSVTQLSFRPVHPDIGVVFHLVSSLEGELRLSILRVLSEVLVAIPQK